ncbi:hypothetical protein GOBAR_AA23967 [Gossypium barbadense]|uniref:RRM domain-containing protein n=1 Tax=Gossypium barbadense TaxID=3634 RepID=A0A2P5X068_GOSBA|nr:hypothetical protein GOBAR_AA23967 [Gossypium barbadense]
MNPLTLVKRLQNINAKEADLGISEEASWHAKYKDSAYIFVGGLPYDLTEGDLLAVFAQYGEIVDVNLVRDKGTGKSKGFAFLAYEDQRSTIIAVDNLNGAQILGRIIRVDHAENRFSRNIPFFLCYSLFLAILLSCARRAANTGWGPQDNKSSRWGNDKYEGSKKSDKSSGMQEHTVQEGFRSSRGDEKALEKRDGREGKRSRRYDGKDAGPAPREDYSGIEGKRLTRHNDDDRYKREEKRSRRHNDSDLEPRSVEDRHRRDENRSRRHGDDGEDRARLKEDRKDESRSKRHGNDEFDPRPNGDHDRRGEKRILRNESESHPREERDKRGGERRTGYNRDSSSHRHGERNKNF